MGSGVADTVWVAANTHQFKEGVAVANLERQGFFTYCPMIRRRTRHARRLREVLRPLFPGYVFIRIDLARDQWRPVLSTVGVRSIIRFGDRLGVLPEAFVESLREREEHGAIALPPARDSYAPGETVRLREGALEGLVATVLSCDDGQRLMLIADMLRRSVRIQARIEDVIPV